MFKPIDIIVLLFIVVQSMLYVFLFPNLENPDGTYHFETIYNNEGGQESIYKDLMSGINDIVINNFGINDYSPMFLNEKFKLFNWETLSNYQSYNSINVMILQLVNLILIIISIIIFAFVLKKSKKISFDEKQMFIRLGLLYYLYPSVGYLVVGVTPDFFAYVYQPFFILLIYLRKHIINILFCVLLFIFSDQGIILNLYFLIIYFIYKYLFGGKYRNRNLMLMLFSIVSVGGIYLFVTNILVKISNNRILEIMLFAQENFGVIYTKFVNFFLGSFYFLGSGNYITFPPLYFIYLIVILLIFKRISFGKKEENVSLKIMLYASIVAICSAILLIPPYSHIRYYLFFIIILLMSGFSAILNDKYLKSDKKYMLVSVTFFVHNVVLILAISAYSWN